ncbi:hypothetical protein PSTG_02386 [Puccinia striiformis f. sp. tritici PST-78]|uniref:Retrovirus-related Pol polyprotein from transposon TNT 1-94-like beta-barrel domain-containing protein n=1 Tax=Puccinia striiformis f. sp. tritici PST-78 TaxID=1165861 RepID=A0A0L0VZ05_9BASI|nr:hypothetical protein PSTG_02386 [Puccinia striiformis f. sp. tritici PST-78]
MTIMWEINQSRIPILNDTNFVKWSNQIYSYCQQKAFHLFLESDKASTATTPKQEESWFTKKSQAAGVITANLSDDHRARFVTKENQNKAHVLWKLLNDHFLSDSAQHQSLTFQNFLQVKFTGTLTSFLHIVNTHIAKMRACGVTIRVPLPDKPIVNKNLLAEQIVAHLPSSSDDTKEILFTKRPLTLKIMREHLDAQCLDFSNSVFSTSTPTVKTESALKAATPFCENGKHNPNTQHQIENCYQLYPHLNTCPKGKPKKKAHAVKASESDEADNSNSVISYKGAHQCVSNRQALRADQGLVSIFLDSGCTDHMFPQKDNFASYIESNSSVSIADGKTIPIIGSGFVKVRNALGDIHTFKALHLPSLSNPLISHGQLFLKNVDLVRDGPANFSMIQSQSKATLFTGIIQGRIFCQVSGFGIRGRGIAERFWDEQRGNLGNRGTRKIGERKLKRNSVNHVQRRLSVGKLVEKFCTGSDRRIGSKRSRWY